MARKATSSPTEGPELILSAVKSEGLRVVNCPRPFAFVIHTRLRILNRTASKKPSNSLRFHLDSCAFASAIPEQWLDGEEGLRTCVEPLTDPVGMHGIGGPATGPLACQVPVQFLSELHAGHIYHFDFLVLRGLNKKKGQKEEAYGLIALRDVANNFLSVQTEGAFVWDNDLCIARPTIRLVRG